MYTVYELSGSPGETTALTVSDTVVSLPSVQPTIYWTGSRAIAVLITCEAANIRFAFNVNPTSSFGHILYVGQSLRLANPVAVKTFKAIQATAGQVATLHITHEYALGA
jgi:hypothetical protein